MDNKNPNLIDIATKNLQENLQKEILAIKSIAESITKDSLLPVSNDVATIKGEVAAIKTIISNDALEKLKNDIAAIQTDLVPIKTGAMNDKAVIKNDLTAFKKEIDNIKVNINALQVNDMAAVKKVVTSIETSLENIKKDIEAFRLLVSPELVDKLKNLVGVFQNLKL